MKIQNSADACAFFNPASIYHKDKIEKLIPHLNHWRSIQKDEGEIELNSKWLQNVCFSNELGKKFKDALLIESNGSYSNLKGAQYCKKWIINKNNYEHILNKLNSFNSPLSVPPADMLYTGSVDEKIDHWLVTYYKKKYEQELKGFKKFEYNDIKFRLWNELQNLPKPVKAKIFEESLPFDYDASTALITFMIEDIKSMGFELDEQKYNLIFEYRDNKSEIRNKFADELEISIDDVKDLFAYLNNKGVLSTSPFKSLYKIMHKDIDKTQYVRDHDYFRKYARQIRSLWSLWLSQHNLQAYFNQIRPVINKEERYSIYFYVERKVLDSIQEFLMSHEFIFFLEHDGFRTDKEINLDQLHLHIKNNLNYNLNFSN